MSDRPEADFTGIVVAAGRAARFGGDLPKQFLELAGRSVLERAVRALADRSSVRGVVVVLSSDQAAGARGAEVRKWPAVEAVVAGGARRADSVLNGVLAARSTPFVLVHDAARPLASAALVERVIDATRRHGAAVPVLEVADTVKVVDGGRVMRTLPRGDLRLAQTPQGARRDWLSSALERARVSGAIITDEASALEDEGIEVAVVEGEPENRKITRPADLNQLRERLAPSPGRMRVGTGFDVHRVDPDRPLVLGGIAFEGHPGLAGHSDADVVLHAAMDALLGAAGLEDIGILFPPTDDRWSGVASTQLARTVGKLLVEQGATIVNLDLTVLAESPKIASHRDRMRGAIAESFGTAPSRVAVKATTMERLGAIGRGEGIACQAVALIELGGSDR